MCDMSLIADTAPSTLGRRRPRALWIALAVLAVLGLVGVSRLVPNAATVDRLTIRNDTGYDLDVDAANVSHDGWTPVGIALAHSSTQIDDVVDHGRVWAFRFSGQGHDGGELAVNRSDLAAAGWQLTVPASVSERLAAAGASPSPTQRPVSK
jgi:hypothetical protein